MSITIRHRGELGAFGYHDVAHMTLRARRAALVRASKSLGWLHIIRKLNALYVLNKRRNPVAAAQFKSDQLFASERHRSEVERLKGKTKPRKKKRGMPARRS